MLSDKPRLRVPTSDTQPFWSLSVDDIRQRFGMVSRSLVSKGMGELRRRKLIEVRYDDLTDKAPDKRFPKMYKVLKLYDPNAREAELRALAETYGAKEYKTARTYAAVVFEEYNPEVIEDIILKARQYGAEKVKRAFAIVAKKNVDNPKRSYGYVVGILENSG